MNKDKMIFTFLSILCTVLLLNGNIFSMQSTSSPGTSSEITADRANCYAIDSEKTTAFPCSQNNYRDISLNTTIKLLMKVLDNRAMDEEARIAAAHALAVLADHRGILIIRDIAHFSENSLLKKVCLEIYHDYIVQEAVPDV